MNCCAWLLLYTLLLSCWRCLWFKSWHEPRSGLWANHFSNNLLNGIASGIGPGPHQCSHRKTKGTVLSNGLFKAPLRYRSWLPPVALPGAIAPQTPPDEKFLSLNRWRKPSGVLSRNDLSYVAGEFRIFGAIFLEDGCSLFECHINLFELGKILFCEVLNFVGGRLRCRFLLNKGGLRRFL